MAEKKPEPPKKATAPTRLAPTAPRGGGGGVDAFGKGRGPTELKVADDEEAPDDEEDEDDASEQGDEEGEPLVSEISLDGNRKIGVEALLKAYAEAIKKTQAAPAKGIHKQLATDAFAKLTDDDSETPEAVRAQRLEQGFQRAIRFAAKKMVDLWSGNAPTAALPPPHPSRSRPPRRIAFSLVPDGFPPGAVRTINGITIIPDVDQKLRGGLPPSLDPVVVIPADGAPPLPTAPGAPQPGTGTRLWCKRAFDGTLMTLRIDIDPEILKKPPAEHPKVFPRVLLLSNGADRVIVRDIEGEQTPRIDITVDDRRDLSDYARAVDVMMGSILDLRMRPHRSTPLWGQMLMNELARELPLLRLPPPLQEACRSFFVHGRGGPLPSTAFALRSLPLMMGRLAGKRGALLEVSKVLAELQATCVKHGQLTTQARGRQNTSGLLRPTKKADDDEDFEGARPVRRSGASSGGGAGPGGGTPNPSRALVTEREEMRNSARAKMVHNEQTNLRARQALMEKLDANKKR